MTQSIPRIDLEDFNTGDEDRRKALIDTLGKGLTETGFLIVKNHGLSADLIARTYEAFKYFFGLDEETKRAYDRVAGGQRGYTPFGREQAKDAHTPDLKEFWHIGQDLSEDHPYRADYPDNIWPEEIAALKPAALDLYRAYERCARTVLEALALYFSLPGNTFADMITDGDSILRVIHYPPLSADAPPGAVRAAAHEDINLITLLTQSEGQGLEILDVNGRWVPVYALDGDIVVDSGDMLKRVTNGIVPATTHRVVNPPEAENKSRYSMPFFAHPYAKCDLTILDRFISEDHPAQWPPITARAFLDQRLAEIGLGS